MTTTDGLELPIQRIKVAGPAVRGLEERKEDNNNERVSVAKFWATYNDVKTKVLDGLRVLGAIEYK
jgi:hypothetical protein